MTKRREGDRHTERILNRELSWIEFNERVLHEATRRENPLMERMKFLAIVQSNLDEFFMVRVGSLADQIARGDLSVDASGLTPQEQLRAIHKRVQAMVKKQYDVFRHGVLPELRRSGVSVLRPDKLTAAQRSALSDLFERTVFPVLTPLAVDSSRPFPLIASRSLHIGVLLHPADDPDGELRFATVQVPAGLARLQRVPSETGATCVLLEQMIERFLPRLFSGCRIVDTCFYRATRNADYMLDEEETEDLVVEVERTLKARRSSTVVRLEVNEGTSAQLVRHLTEALDVEPEAVYAINGSLNLDFLWRVYAWPGYERLKYPVFIPRLPSWYDEETDLFDVIAHKDRFLHHPYDSFEPVIAFVQRAARSSDVLAIKQTLYRVGGNSPIVRALAEAAQSGKQVTVLLEVKARFDEENNIAWGKKLEEAGAHVIYGLMGLKTHSKITLVVRREESGIRRYVHLGTGNYNESTARQYTDMGLLTADEAIGEDASAFFNMVTGYSEPARMHRLVPAPYALRERFTALIEEECLHALAGRPSGIFAKMNSLVDEGIIEALYRASQAGVPVRLIVRGICCLRPGVEGLSENIEVRSLIGRFLEHPRVFLFEGGGRSTTWLSSADWMPRNLDRRVELLFPVGDEDIRAEIRRVLELQWGDNCQTHRELPDGSYEHVSRRGRPALNAQEALIRQPQAQV